MKDNREMKQYLEVESGRDGFKDDVCVLMAIISWRGENE